MDNPSNKIYYHLPGLFEFYSFYKEFLPLYKKHSEYFYEWCDIGSIYGVPADCLWGGGRVGFGDNNAEDILNLIKDFNISARLTFSNSLLKTNHLSDKKCNNLCKRFYSKKNGIILHSDLLLSYIKENYPDFYFVSSTTKVLTDFNDFKKELENTDFSYVVPDFRLNIQKDCLALLDQKLKNKVEFLCNECCSFTCKERKNCYENVSRKNLGEKCINHICEAPGGNDGYKFSLAMKNPGFISLDAIKNIYAPMGFSNFKIEGRSLGNAFLLEFILYYMTKPEYHIKVREELYLDNMLDLF